MRIPSGRTLGCRMNNKALDSLLYYCIYFSYMDTIINIKTKKDLKENAKKTASELGLSLSAVINGYLRQFVRNKAVYFSLAPTMTPELERLLGKIEYDIARGKNISKPVCSASGLKKHLASL